MTISNDRWLGKFSNIDNYNGDNYFVIPETFNLNQTSGFIRMMVNINIVDFSNNYVTADFFGYDDAEQSVYFGIENSNNKKIYYYYNNGNVDNVFLPKQDIFDGNTHELIFSYDENGGRFYIDGILESSADDVVLLSGGLTTSSIFSYLYNSFSDVEDSIWITDVVISNQSYNPANPEMSNYHHALRYKGNNNAQYNNTALLENDGFLSPILHYKMNDNTDTAIVVDSSVNENNGTAQVNTSGLTTTGKINEALSFNGSSDYVSIANEISFAGDFTVSMWIKPVDATLGQNLLFTPFFNFYIDSNTFLSYNNGNPNISSLSLSNGVWQHVILVSKNGDVLIKLNNVDDSFIFSAANAGNSGFVIGADGSGSGGFFLGDIDDVRIYNQALTREQITSLYNSGNGTETESMTDLSQFNLSMVGTVPNPTLPTPPSGITAWLTRNTGNNNNYLTIPTSIKPENDKGFISAWFQYSDDLIGESDIIDLSINTFNYDTSYFYLYMESQFGEFDGQVLIFQMTDKNYNWTEYFIDAIPYMDNVPHKIVVSWDKYDTKIYIDDILITTLFGNSPQLNGTIMEDGDRFIGGYDDTTDGDAYIADVIISSAEYVPPLMLSSEQDNNFYIARFKGNHNLQLVNEISSHRDARYDLLLNDGPIDNPFDYTENVEPTKWLGYWNGENQSNENEFDNRILTLPITTRPQNEAGHISMLVKFSTNFYDSGSGIDLYDLDTADELGQNERNFYVYTYSYNVISVIEIDYQDVNGDNQYVYLSNTKTIADGNNHKIVLSWDGINMKAYIDDVQVDILNDYYFGVAINPPSPDFGHYSDYIYQNGLGYYNNNIYDGAFMMMDDFIISSAEYAQGQSQDTTKYICRYNGQ